MLVQIPAAQLKQGMTVCFDNARFDFLVEEVTVGIDEVRVTSRDDSYVEWFELDDLVTVSDLCYNSGTATNKALI